MKYIKLYEDESILIVDKVQGLAVTPGKIEDLCTLIFQEYPEIKLVKGFKDNEGGLLNRLDNETGGIIFFAKNDNAFHYYNNEMKENRVKKFYMTVVDGIPSSPYGIIDSPIAHHAKSKKKMVIALNKKHRSIAKESKTSWKLLKTIKDKAILEVIITKGTRHQIRIHLASIGLPITGDKLYNKKPESDLYPNHLLYAYKTILTLINNEKFEIITNVPFLKIFKLI